MDKVPDLLANYWPAWIVVVAWVLSFLKKAIEDSEALARNFGRVGKKLRERALKRKQITMNANDVATAVTTAVEAEREKWANERDDVVEGLKGQVSDLSAIMTEQDQRIDRLTLEQRASRAYVEYEEWWHHQFSLLAATSTDDTVPRVKLPRHTPFYEFLPKFEQNPDWRQWAM